LFSTKSYRTTTRSFLAAAGPSCSVSSPMASPPTRSSRRSRRAWERRLLPGEEEADIARHASRILEHLGPQPEAERSQMFVPEFVAELGAPLQSLFPSGFRVVDFSAAVPAQAVRKAVGLVCGLFGLGVPVDERREEMHQ